MNKYELGVIIRADLDEDTYRSEQDRVKGLLDRFGGSIEKIDDWGRRKLAYPIQKLTEGMYTFISYSSEGSTPKEVENRLRLMENVLRFMTVRKDEPERALPVAQTRGEAAENLEEEAKPAEAAPAGEGGGAVAAASDGGTNE